jgi:biotin operon repressor
MSASALARVLPVSRQAIGKHLEVLREVGSSSRSSAGAKSSTSPSAPG